MTAQERLLSAQRTVGKSANIASYVNLMNPGERLSLDPRSLLTSSQVSARFLFGSCLVEVSDQFGDFLVQVFFLLRPDCFGRGMALIPCSGCFRPARTREACRLLQKCPAWSARRRIPSGPRQGVRDESQDVRGIGEFDEVVHGVAPSCREVG